MEIVNRTPLPAIAQVTRKPGTADRTAIVTAKATFSFDLDEQTRLETQHPFPLLDQDQPTEFGALPADVFPCVDPAFSVILLGYAHANQPGGVTTRKVHLSVGAVTREIQVFGERAWLDRNTVSKPVPFDRMPLVYERAFGGRCDVYLDENSPLEVCDPRNKYGRGFDPEPTARLLRDTLRLPAVPTFDAVRLLPNLEDPQALIRRWDDSPFPLCWAATPADAGIRVDGLLHAVSASPVSDAEQTNRIASRRAHPDWTIDLPPPNAVVSLVGLSSVEHLRFRLPGLRVFADYVAGAATGTVELRARLLVLLPERRQFYLVYSEACELPYEGGTERCFRLRAQLAPN